MYRQNVLKLKNKQIKYHIFISLTSNFKFQTSNFKLSFNYFQFFFCYFYALQERLLVRTRSWDWKCHQVNSSSLSPPLYSPKYYPFWREIGGPWPSRSTFFQLLHCKTIAVQYTTQVSKLTYVALFD